MLSVRPVRPSEIALLPAIERSAGERFRAVGLDDIADGEDRPAEFHRARAEAGLVWVAEEDGVLVGHLTSEAFPDALHVWALDVHLEAQGRGIGRALLRSALDETARRGLPAVTLTTFCEIPWNAPFYRRHGFVELDPADLGERLARIRAEEAAEGLDVRPRCAMRLALPGGAERGGHQAPFASIDLAARIDRAEMRLTATLASAAVEARGGDGFVGEIAGGVAAFVAPSSPMNKVIGVGYDGLPDDLRLRQIEALFQARNAPLHFEVATLADPSFAAALTRRGYVLEGFENVLGRRVGDAPADAAPFAIAITEMRDVDADRWLDASVAGILDSDDQGVAAAPLPAREQLKRLLADFITIPSLRRYCAWVDGELAATASLRTDQGLAQLCGATTLQRFRRRGIQTALLRRRLEDARRDGCDLAVMTTQPGSTSQKNGQRHGFTLLYSRAVLVKRPS